jgi:hypothetical protein
MCVSYGKIEKKKEEKKESTPAAPISLGGGGGRDGASMCRRVACPDDDVKSEAHCLVRRPSLIGFGFDAQITFRPEGGREVPS